MKKELIVILLKVIAYAIGLLLAYFGASTLVSCTVSRSLDSTGRCTVITTDTTYINHKGYSNFPRK